MKNYMLYTILLVVFVVFISAQILIQTIENDIVIGVATALQSGITVLGVISILYQMKRGRQINELDFFIRLKISFVNDKQMMELYGKLQHEDECEETNEQANISINSLEISRYLDFFDSIYIALTNKILSFSIIDNAFSYFFFIAVHSKKIQEKELYKYAEYYENIYLLYDIWIEYRNKHNKKTINIENPLIRPNKQSSAD